MSSMACLVCPRGFSGRYMRFLLALQKPCYPLTLLVDTGFNYILPYSHAFIWHFPHDFTYCIYACFDEARLYPNARYGIKPNVSRKRLTDQTVSSMACLVCPR
eukprot:706059-Ditylum_brightwellii.AAC.1